MSRKLDIVAFVSSGEMIASVWTFVFCVPFVALYNRLVGEVPSIEKTRRAEKAERA